MVFLVGVTGTIMIVKWESVPSPFPWPKQVEGIKKFSSEQEFKEYLQQGQLGYGRGLGLGLGGARARARPTPTRLEAGQEAPERVSKTTVQVAGIDEPDIVKTDGTQIYFSSSPSYYWRGFQERTLPETPATKVVTAFPPADLELQTKIDKEGDLLLDDHQLVILAQDKIYGYDVSDPENPHQQWTLDLDEDSSVAGARLFNHKIYLIVNTEVDYIDPCPVKPLSSAGEPVAIQCNQIYHPTQNISADVTYNAMVLDPSSGEIKDSLSLVGSSDRSVIYMSKQGIYITYSYSKSLVDIFDEFFNKQGQDLVPDRFRAKLDKLKKYDISETAKMMEISFMLERYFGSLEGEKSEEVEQQLEQKMDDYFKEHRKEIERTGIVKVNLSNFEISATGDVPGRPLNQFSLDEYNNHLRIATTLGGNLFGGGESSNAVYVLDKNCNLVGAVGKLGLEETIYSVRFIKDKGYVVTFRRIDPFFVIDLSEPSNPQLEGKLKIPGYSSYLHPITKDKILGVGKEESKVKLSWFDVSDPENPIEKDKYILKEHWSDVLKSHHAFLLDKKHQVFFLPGAKAGYIFSYQNHRLKLMKKLTGFQARRAIYLDDYLYLIGNNSIRVVNEIDWEEVNQLQL